MKVVRVGLCGLGTVGSGVFNLLNRNNALINSRANKKIVIVHVGARRDTPNVDLAGIKISRDIFSVARDPDVDILVELIGGVDVAKQLVLEAIANGKHIVTANKALIAHHGVEIFFAADKKGVSVCYEAAVAGGIPIIKSLREGLAANQVEWLAGIINGTTNFILTEMSEKGRAFDDVLKEVQLLGYAEADPTFDVEGIDAAHKLIILAAIAFGMPLEVEKVYTEGITNLSVQDINFAKELGYNIRHLGIARRTEKGIELRVHPTLIPQSQLIANVSGVMNAVLVKGDGVGATLYCGSGAGSEPTASAVISDVIDTARAMGIAMDQRVPALGQASSTIKTYAVLNMDDIYSEYYLRIMVKDEAGVLSEISKILSEAGISIEALIQKEPRVNEVMVSIVLLTNKVQEKILLGVIRKIAAVKVIGGAIVVIRIETLDQ